MARPRATPARRRSSRSSVLSGSPRQRAQERLTAADQRAIERGVRRRHWLESDRDPATYAEAMCAFLRILPRWTEWQSYAEALAELHRACVAGLSTENARRHLQEERALLLELGEDPPAEPALSTDAELRAALLFDAQWGGFELPKEAARTAAWKQLAEALAEGMGGRADEARARLKELGETPPAEPEHQRPAKKPRHVRRCR